jgi:hypothetical protein
MVKGNLRYNLTSLLCSVSVAIVYMLLVSSSSTITTLPTVFATTAESMFQSKSLTLPPNIKHLVILLPNEAHESQQAGDLSSDQRLINQISLKKQLSVPVQWLHGLMATLIMIIK